MERILSIATERASGAIPTQGRRAVVDRAVWFCACVTDNGADAPTWLIYDTDNGGLGWCRVGNDDDMDDLVDAKELFGDHVHPGQVAEWLQGADPRRVFGLGDAEALRELGRKIRELHED
ncbi:hypothetical protein [Nocardioides sp. WS12]|uniref:hypothetical protein n=1 Tax=Nocardioides sp. WS12 TaxID=2486272 RepID=UPI0015FD24AC|nr:hypothetical protein [Nocardioides sp. WS12]